MKKDLFAFSRVIFLIFILLYFTQYLSLGQTTTTRKTLAIGDTYQGGKIAYLLRSGDAGFNVKEQHGLIVSPKELSDGSEWGCAEKVIAGADAPAIGKGNQNTKDIIAGCSQPAIAARRCSDMELNGYSDWYLPSKDELNKLYLNRAKIGSFSDAFYWTSCESDATFAWGQDFYDGTQGRVSKDSAGHVQAVRAF
jgi:hypothetical protein